MLLALENREQINDLLTETFNKLSVPVSVVKGCYISAGSL